MRLVVRNPPQAVGPLNYKKKWVSLQGEKQNCHFRDLIYPKNNKFIFQFDIYFDMF